MRGKIACALHDTVLQASLRPLFGTSRLRTVDTLDAIHAIDAANVGENQL